MLRAAISNSRTRFLAASLSITITGSATAAAASTSHYKKKDADAQTFHLNWIPFQGGTQCSSNPQNNILLGTELPNDGTSLSLSLEVKKDPTQNQAVFTSNPFFSSLVPTLQATNRGRRLVQTVVLMIMDYEKAKLDGSQFMKAIRYMETFAQDVLQISAPIIQLRKENENGKLSSEEKEEGSLDIEHLQVFWEEELNKRKNNLQKAQNDYTSEPKEQDLNEWAKLHMPNDSSSPKEKVCPS